MQHTTQAKSPVGLGKTVLSVSVFLALSAGAQAGSAKVSWEDISSLIERYLAGESNPNVATLVRLRTSTLNSDPRMDAKISELGYSRLTAQNAFWWQKQ